MLADIEVPIGKDRKVDRRIGARHISLRRAVAIAVSLGLGGTVLAACGASATTNAKQACGYVEKSISQYQLAQQQSNPQKITKDKNSALRYLGSALPLAAIAAGSNGEYQALGATLSESPRVPEKLLITALTRECAQVLPTKSNQQVPGGFVPPANVKATS